MWSNRFNALRRELAIERIAVVGKIPDKSSGSSHGEGLIEGSLDKGDFMWASTSRVEFFVDTFCANVMQSEIQ